MPFRPRDSKSKDPGLRLAGDNLTDQQVLDYLGLTQIFFSSTPRLSRNSAFPTSPARPSL